MPEPPREEAVVGQVEFSRTDLVRYAEASGDDHELHLNPAVARDAGFPDVIAHGMLTMSHVARLISQTLPRPTDLVELRVRFRQPVLVGEAVTVKIRGSIPGELEVWAELNRGGEVLRPVSDGSAIIRA
jgi:acyl dehydratase